MNIFCYLEELNVALLLSKIRSFKCEISDILISIGDVVDEVFHLSQWANVSFCELHTQNTGIGILIYPGEYTVIESSCSSAWSEVLSTVQFLIYLSNVEVQVGVCCWNSWESAADGSWCRCFIIIETLSLAHFDSVIFWVGFEYRLNSCSSSHGIFTTTIEWACNTWWACG